MKNISYTITLISLLSFALPAFSKDVHKCIIKKSTLIYEEVKSPAFCKVTHALELREKFQTYPDINVGPLKVRYWKGQFEKTESITRTHRYDYINICTGRITYSYSEPTVFERTKSYSLQNPNLDSTITESYKTAAMTEAEAQFAFENLKVECESDLLK